jgi:acetoin utilization deacetylase AcuC-like enzyme
MAGPETLLLADDAMLCHVQDPRHPESPERLLAIRERLAARPVAGTRWHAPRPATREEVARVHSPEYVELVDRVRGRRVHLDPDVVTSAGTTDASYLAAGAAVEAVEAVVSGRGEQRVRAGAAARAPRGGRAGDGVLRVRECGDRRGARAQGARVSSAC